MKRTAKLALGLAIVLVSLTLLLLPVVPITVALTAPQTIATGVEMAPASASVTYAYFGMGAVYVESFGGGHVYCLMYGNPGTMCGQPWLRL